MKPGRVYHGTSPGFQTRFTRRSHASLIERLGEDGHWKAKRAEAREKGKRAAALTLWGGLASRKPDGIGPLVLCQNWRERNMTPAV